MSEEIKKEKGHFGRNWLLYTILILGICASGFLWISKNIALKKQANVFETEKSLILQQAQETLKANAEKHLELMMKTFSWAVRGEMTRGNQEQVDQYFKQLVKIDKVEEVTLVDRAGTIIVSSNKKNEGNKLEEEYLDAIINTEETTVMDRMDKQIVVSPVMGLNSQLGTLMVVYKADFFQLHTATDLTKIE